MCPVGTEISRSTYVLFLSRATRRKKLQLDIFRPIFHK